MFRLIPLLMASGLFAQEPTAVELKEEAAYRAEMLAKERAWITETISALDQANEFELMSLTTEGFVMQTHSCRGFCFQRWQVRGSAPIRAPFEVEAVRTELRRWLDGPAPNAIPLCFFPHHGARMRVADAVFDFVICYECKQMQVYRDFELGGRNAVHFESDRNALDRLLEAHRVEPTGLN